MAIDRMAVTHAIGKIEMKLAMIATVAAVILWTSFALAQNAGTGSATPTGDAAVSPAAGNHVTSGSATHPDLGAGIASGAVNNGTTGDTIGTGHGTSNAPAASPGAVSSVTGARKE
jgi:hypothetical protein